MLNWMQNGPQSSKVIDSNIGNHSRIATTTGGTASDIINNIFDLGGNLFEWTLGVNSQGCRELKGGNYYGGSASMSMWDYSLKYAYSDAGSRLSLYIK